jgi:uncharacterized protein YfbU (UPF0304 family)
MEEICKTVLNLLRFGAGIRVSVSGEIKPSEILNKYATLFFVAKNYSNGSVKNYVKFFIKPQFYVNGNFYCKQWK